MIEAREMDSLKETLQRVHRQICVKIALREEREENLRKLEQDYTQLTEDVRLLDKVDQVLLAVSGKVLGKSTVSLDKLVTAGLRVTFDDQNLEFKATVDRYRGKTSVDFELLQDGKGSPIMESYGGGVLVVSGVLLRVVVIMALGLRRVLILDETMSHLARSYIPNASRLLRKIAAELDFKILMVSHDPEFAEFADKHYEAYREGGSTKMRVVKVNKAVADE